MDGLPNSIAEAPELGSSYQQVGELKGSSGGYELPTPDYPPEADGAARYELGK